MRYQYSSRGADVAQGARVGWYAAVRWHPPGLGWGEGARGPIIAESGGCPWVRPGSRGRDAPRLEDSRLSPNAFSARGVAKRIGRPTARVPFRRALARIFRARLTSNAVSTRRARNAIVLEDGIVARTCTRTHHRGPRWMRAVGDHGVSQASIPFFPFFPLFLSFFFSLRISRMEIVRALGFWMRVCVCVCVCMGTCVYVCVCVSMSERARMDTSFGCCPRGDIDGSVVGTLL